MQALGSEHETLHDAIGTVSEILRRFGKDDHFRADCMFARLNEISFKYKLDGDLSAAIAAYEVFLAICRAEDGEQQKGLRLYALVNGAEHLILNGQFDKARSWLNEALPLASVRDEEFAVISFLLWLVDPSYPLERVLKSIEELAPDVDFGFEYGELREFVAKLEPEIREVALAIIGFFDDHHTVGKLKEALARILPA